MNCPSHLRRAATAAIVLALTVPGPACNPPRFEEATLVLLDVHVIDPHSGNLIEDRMVVVQEDRILAIEPSDGTRVPATAKSVQGRGAFLIPGLVDMHVHVLSGVEDALQRTFPLLLANGITTVRDMGSELPVLEAVRARLLAEPGRLPPQVFAAGPLLDGTRKPWYGNLPLIVETPQQAREKIPELRDAGVDFLKVYDDLDPETYMAIAATAAAANLHFAGHVPSQVSVAQAVDAGQQTIEHFGFSTVKDCVDNAGSWFQRSIEAKFQLGYDAYYGVVGEHWGTVDWDRCAPVLTALGKTEVFFTPTLDMELNDRSRIDADALKYMPSRSRGWCDTVLSRIDAVDAGLREASFRLYLDSFFRIRDSGVTLLAGSDTPNNCLVEGFSLHWELSLLVEAGLTPQEALRAATHDAARALGREDRSGLIEVGYQADLVLLAGNPLEDIEQTRHIRGVVRQGRWLDRDALDGLLAGALAAAEATDPDR